VTDPSTLDLNDLDEAGIRLTYGLTMCRAKDTAGTNKLLAALTDVFKKEYEARIGKIPLDTPVDAHIDFEEYSPADLKDAFAYFSSLAAAFQSSSHKSSADFCLTILGSISSALSSHQGAGHA
jgi:hypothetical protein